MSRIETYTRKIAECKTLKKEEDYWPEMLAEELANCEESKLKDKDFIFERISEHLSPLLEDDKIASIAAEIHRKIAPKTINVQGMLNKVYSKELKKRPYHADDIALTERMFRCDHQWYHDQGGPHCQVCDFETTKQVWHCSNKCGITLCGSCTFKWKHKMPKIPSM